MAPLILYAAEPLATRVSHGSHLLLLANLWGQPYPKLHVFGRLDRATIHLHQHQDRWTLSGTSLAFGGKQYVAKEWWQDALPSGATLRQVMRRTHASLYRQAGIDPKLVADQLGHGLGVNLDVYTVADLDQRQQAVQTLEATIVRPQQR
jgi:hypothetical protein